MNYQRRLFGIWLALSCLALCEGRAHGQMVIDWAGPKLVSYPQIVNGRMDTTVVVKNVNDLLYTYEVKLVPIPMPGNDAANLIQKSALMDLATIAKQQTCSSAIAKLKLDVQKLADVFDCNQSKNSVPLATTIKKWNDLKTPFVSGSDIATVTEKCIETADRPAGGAAVIQAQASVDAMQNELMEPINSSLPSHSIPETAMKSISRKNAKTNRNRSKPGA